MKKILFVLLLIIAFDMQAQTIFSYGKKTVSKEDFIRAFKKNNNGVDNSEKAYRDYLNLYIRFKLKVQAAYDAHLDTLDAQKTELKNFSNQIAEGFMNDEASVQLLVDEAFERSQKDLRIAHIFIPYTGTDTVAAYKKIKTAYSKLQTGADFGSVATSFSEDPSVKHNMGDLGYISVFSLPYELETLAYSTPSGKYSPIYRSKTAYHIFKTTAIRPAFGRMKLAQILLAFPPGAGDLEKESIHSLADSLYTALKNGANFKDLVLHFSNDNISYQTGGLLPEFGIGKYSPDFENAAFSLEHDGDISKPVLTSYGYHIMQRVERLPVNTDKKDAKRMASLKQAVQNDKRILLAKQALAHKILTSAGYKKGVYSEPLLLQYMDSIADGKIPPTSPVINDKTLLFSLPGKKYYVPDFVKYYQSNKLSPEVVRGKTMTQLLQQYTETVATEFYRNHLEKYDKEYAYQLNEFKDGNMLFEIMQQQVWEKAARDSSGLKKYYNGHKDKYWWESSADAIIFTCSDSLSAVKVRTDYIKAPKDWRNIVQNTNGTVQADSSRFELTQIPINAEKIQPGIISQPVKNGTDNSCNFTTILNIYKERAPRNFEDAKGFVINDYQSLLEDNWVETLKKKYPIVINQAVLQSCWK
jgi:peptidyl-prolyl cis-trans isomerase SurA